MSRLLTKDELNQLATFRSLQDTLNEQAARVFEAWDTKNHLPNATRYFKRAEVTGDGLVEIHFEVGSCCSGFEFIEESLTVSFDDFIKQAQ